MLLEIEMNISASECGIQSHVSPEDIFRSPEALACEWFEGLTPVNGSRQVERYQDCLRWCVRAVTLVTGVEGRLILAKTKGTSEAAFARQLVCYFLNTVMGINLSRVSRLISRDRSTVSYAITTIENLRGDNAQLELEFDRMYSAIILAIGEPVHPDRGEAPKDGRYRMKNFNQRYKKEGGGGV